MIRKIGWICMVLPGILCALHAQAQQVQLTGKLVDAQDETPLIGATVTVVNRADSSKQRTITNMEGTFGFSGLEKGFYQLNISYIGYEELGQRLRIGDTPQDLGILKMKPGTEQLKEVEVAGRRQRVSQEGDTTNYHAGSYKTTPDASAEDLIRKMPGITVEGGKVQAQGEDVQRVLVDGKQFFGNDAAMALKNLPAEVIDKIQVFDQQSEQSQFTGFSDGNEMKTLNIVTRPDMRNGEFGKVYGGYGYDNKYRLGGNINIFNGDRRISLIGQSNNINQQNFSTEDLLGVVGGSGGGRRGAGGPGGGRGGRGGGRGTGGWGGGSGVNDFMVGQQAGVTNTHAFGLNYSDRWGEKLELSGSYFFNNSINLAEQQLYRTYFTSAEEELEYREQMLNKSENMNHRFNLRMDYKINEANSLLFTPSLSFQSNKGMQSLWGANLFGLDEAGNTTESLQQSDIGGYNFSSNILFRHRFEKPRRTLSVNLTTGLNGREGEQYLESVNQALQREQDAADSLNQRTDMLTKGYRLGANLVYTEPVGEGMLQFTYNASYQDNMSERLTLRRNEALQYTQLDSLLSSTFYNDYFTQRAGTGYRYRKGKTMLMTGLDYQWAVLSGEQQFPRPSALDRNFRNLLPNAMLRYDISKDKNLRVFYRTNTNPPSVEQMQPVIDNTNPLQLRTGNAALVQEYRHNLFARFNSNNVEKASSFFALIGGSYTQDYVGTETFIARRDTLLAEGVLLQNGGQLIRPVNLDGNWSGRAFMTYGLPVPVIKSNINLNTSFNYNRLPGIINGRTNFANTYAPGIGVVLSSNISEYVDFTLSTNGSYTIVKNSLQSTLDQNYYNQTSYARLKWISPSGWLLENDLNYLFYAGLSEEVDQGYMLYNVSFGKRLFRNRRGEIKLTVFDVLNQNNSIQRHVTEAYVEDVTSNVLNRFGMLTFTYDVRSFGSR